MTRRRRLPNSQGRNPQRERRAGSASDNASRTRRRLPPPARVSRRPAASSALAIPPTHFCCCASSDVLGSATYIPLLWAGLHVVKASLSTWGGALSDRLGRKRVIIIGWTIYAVVYIGFATARDAWTLDRVVSRLRRVSSR